MATSRASPARILTFFPWEHAAPGHLGVGETQETAFRIPAAAIGYWTHRLHREGRAACAGEALRRERADVPRSRRHALRAGRRAGRRERDGLEPRHSGRARDPRLSWRDPAGQRREADRRDPHRCARLPRSRARGRARALSRRCADGRPSSICARRAISRAAARAAARCITSRSARPTMPRRPRWRRSWSRTTTCIRPSRRTATTSARSISASRTASCSRSRPIEPGFAVDEPASELGHALKLPRFLEPRRAELEAKLPPLAETV